MLKKGEIKRKRIIVYYILAIVLPCLILGVLAFRGIKNDQALVEREQQRHLLETGQQIITETDNFLSSVEKDFAQIIELIAFPDKPIFKDSVLSRFINQHQTVKGSFFISEADNVSVLNNNMLYIPDEYLMGSPVIIPRSTQKILDIGWEYEFRKHNNTEALKYYQSALSGLSGKQSKAEILNAVARIQKKLKLKDEAIKTYDRIAEEYPQVLLWNKIPFGATALMENSLLYFDKKDTVHALQTALQLLENMKKSAWEMGYSTYTNFYEKTDEITSRCNSSRNEENATILERINLLKDSLSIMNKQTKTLLSFLENNQILPVSKGTDAAKNKNRFRIPFNGESCFCSTVPVNKGHWGLIINKEFILGNKVYPSIIENASQTDFSWEVSIADGEMLLQSEQPPGDAAPVFVAFPPELPSWTMKFYPVDEGLFVSLFRPQEGIFLYIFILIAILLVFGLFFTLHTVNNELNLSRMKSYFMSTVSHEFKSPLTSIRQMAEMLMRQRVPTNERKVKYYTTILQQSERLSHLIDNILDFTKMEEGHKVFRFEQADIRPVVKDVVELFREITAGSGFKINLEISDYLPKIIFDREAIGQVVYNLIDNAFKYSRESKVIDVRLFREDNDIVFSVQDYGVGIRKEDHEKIFSRFYRAGEELSHNVKGSGIGLAIVKQIVAAHHGEITVESSSGKGSRFSVKLPVKNAYEEKNINR
jgi:signal transduction histidine kinase/tetratricopeptide (TPR) repeat protein